MPNTDEVDILLNEPVPKLQEIEIDERYKDILM